jgi:NAD(P)-dependent dehydrogenase (short-subunit alcohol dehydrogenase family)
MTHSIWSNRSVWLVGASSGIGLALAEALHARGARVAVSARQATLLDAFVAQHPGASAHPVDVCQVEQLQHVAQTIHAQQGLDLVVYCAGYYKAMRTTTFDLTEMIKHNDINYVGALHLLHAVLPHLQSQGHGHLSFISSVAGFRGLPMSLAYGPSKAALTHLAEVLYLDLQPQGIDVSVIHPGFVETPMTAQNTFEMPAMITASEAARDIIRGWERGEFEIHFPKRFTRFLKLLRLLPDRWYFSLIQRITRASL